MLIEDFKFGKFEVFGLPFFAWPLCYPRQTNTTNAVYVDEKRHQFEGLSIIDFSFLNQ